MAKPTDSIQSIAGCRVRLQRGGEGPPLLFLHGARGVGWLPFLRALSERFDVIVPDHPGFGLSDTLSRLERVNDLADYYVDFLADMGLGGVHIVGSSLGGWIAAALAARSTERIATLTLISPAGIDLPEVPKPDIFQWSPEEEIRNLFADQRIAEVLLSLAVGEEQRRRQARDDATAARLARDPYLHDPGLPPRLGGIDRPTQIVWGDSDRVIPPAFGAAYRELIPGALLEVVAKCGHLPHVEKAHEIVRLVARFAGRSVPRWSRGTDPGNG